jgi:hypothetical protein
MDRADFGGDLRRWQQVVQEGKRMEGRLMVWGCAIKRRGAGQDLE